MKRRYTVKFLKEVLGNNGQQAEVCQGLFEVEASDRDEAERVGKERFTTRTGLNWRLHADRIHVAET